MKSTNFLKMLLTMTFIVGILSSIHAGQKEIVLSPSTGEAQVEQAKSKTTPENVKLQKEETQAETSDIKVSPGEPKSEPKVMPNVPKAVQKKVKPDVVKEAPKSSLPERKMQKATPGGDAKIVPGQQKLGETEIMPRKKDREKDTGGFVPLKVEKKQEVEIAVKCFGMTPTIVGTSGDDILYGTQESDVIHGLGGNDKINGLGGDDIICGGDGNDELEGASGNDRLFGGDGDDTLWGSDGNDELYGGRDTIGLLQDEENDGNDKIYGGAGNDGLYGGSGDDCLYGGDGDDHLNGGSGMDRLGGNDGKDVIEGGSGDDQLYGGSGDDVLYGYIAPKGGVNLLGGEDDVNDKLDGGIGNDICIVCNGNVIPPINCEE